mmetsp:Transcript_35810/g.83296  ORF Transcript_35810/g.83296 Transcript_35810/m.83296 type:complete len:349 (-) Transcript_35810:166-1212(-)
MAPLTLGVEAEDEEEEELLAALEESLEELLEDSQEGAAGALVGQATSFESTAPSMGTQIKAARTAGALPWPLAVPPSKDLGYGLVCWPVEVRIGVASFLPWQELIKDSILCQSWYLLEKEDVLWQVYFQNTWPRFSRRREAHQEGNLPWRSLFRNRWAKNTHAEDALEEDWLDFSAAQDLLSDNAVSKSRSPTVPGPSASELQHALRRCREDLLRTRGIVVPTEASENHVCSRQCRFHRVAVAGDVFLCESSGGLHRCRDGQPCDLCVSNDDDCYLVCPVSGRCFYQLKADVEAEHQAPEMPAWDPELSMTEQYGRWFEQGYFMSEEQARALFGHREGRRARHLGCRV